MINNSFYINVWRGGGLLEVGGHGEHSYILGVWNGRGISSTLYTCSLDFLTNCI